MADAEPTTKTCTKCAQTKPLEDFYRRPEGQIGVKSWCKACCHAGRRKWHELNTTAEVARVAKWRAENPRKVMDAELRRRYGIGADDYDRLLEAQRGACAICRVPFSECGAPHVDHCHGQGSVRGLLCSPCNRGVGHFKDEPERLMAAARYLGSATRWP